LYILGNPTWILGNSCIGKTYFGYVLLLHFARFGAAVEYESGKAEKQELLKCDGQIPTTGEWGFDKEE
jgi:hypothetical protein